MDLHIGDTAVSSVKSGCNSSECSIIPDELEEPANHIILLDKDGAIYCKKASENNHSQIQLENQEHAQCLRRNGSYLTLRENQEKKDADSKNQNLMDYNICRKNTLRGDYLHDQKKISSIQSKPKLNYSIQKVVNISDIEEFNVSLSNPKRPPLAPITEQIIQKQEVAKCDEKLETNKYLKAKDFIESEHEIVTLKIDINQNSKQDEVFVTNTVDGSVKRLVFTSSQRNGERKRKAKNYNSMNSGSHSINCDSEFQNKTVKISNVKNDQNKENINPISRESIPVIPLKYLSNSNKMLVLNKSSSKKELTHLNKHIENELDLQSKKLKLYQRKLQK